MEWIRPLIELEERDAAWAGGKAVRLGQLMRAGYRVPPGVVVSSVAYRRFIDETGLEAHIRLLMGRKRFDDMRWEEIWDLALRIRNLFARTAYPGGLHDDLSGGLGEQFARVPTVVRSTALGEDSATASFAGLHESFVNVRGIDRILDRIRMVWASLWSDRALLYRRELGLDPRRSSIAVIVQELADGRASGVAFSRSPMDPGSMLVEGIWGLNQAMVDGTIAPHRWSLDRGNCALGDAQPVQQSQALRLRGDDTRLVPLVEEERVRPPLEIAELKELCGTVRHVEQLFAAPQDVEWTVTDRGLCLLQARPITAGEDSDDKRRWYLSLHRSVDNLESLRSRIRQELLPEMDRQAAELSAVELDAISETELVAEIRRRRAVVDRAVDDYWRDCIPFAHGMRLFGEVYNDRCQPEDPFEFVDLLRSGDLLGQQRNAEMLELAGLLRKVGSDGPAEKSLQREQAEKSLQRELEEFLAKYGLSALAANSTGREELISFLGRLPSAEQDVAGRRERAARFLERFEGDERASMGELLELARDSYRLRDNDNIYLGRLEAELVRALDEAERRVGQQHHHRSEPSPVAELIQLLEDPQISAPVQKALKSSGPTVGFEVRARQLVGQPASAGLAVGPARVILDPAELLSFREGEILVCDSIDPNMTFVAPLAAAVVERRGGMLIHGAIIAREYGIPCVTGIPQATEWIHTGDTITVDGHVGLVTVSTPQI